MSVRTYPRFVLACDRPGCGLMLSIEGVDRITEARAEARREHGWGWVPGPTEWVDLCARCLPRNVVGAYARRGGRLPRSARCTTA